jgi:catechol 2,3-dioxygenase-like lactoylglutathione lyase family enzyme
MARCYIEHVAIHVSDIAWHVRFFREVLGLGIRDVDGSPDDPKQVWTEGGVQLIATPGFVGPEGRLGHLGVMAEDAEAMIRAAESWGVTATPKGRNWLALPDGLVIEILQASPGSVAAALAVDPRG